MAREVPRCYSRNTSDGATNYDSQASHLVAEILKGRLLITCGKLDTNVPHSNTMLAIDAFIAANKDFDLLLYLNHRRGFRSEPYMIRRHSDYFVRHFPGVTPPPPPGAVRIVTRPAPARRSGQRVSAYLSTCGVNSPLRRCDFIASA